MIRVPTLPKNYVSRPDATLNSALPGLDVPISETDRDQLAIGAAAAVTADVQAWKAAATAWENEYMAARAGYEARTAAEDARTFHRREFTRLQRKYAHDPGAARILQTEGSALGARGVIRMQAYALEQNRQHVDNVLAQEESELRETLCSPWRTAQQRNTAFSDYAFKAGNWRRARGESREAVTAWKQDLARQLTRQLLGTRFDRLLQSSGDAALHLARCAAHEAEPGRDAARDEHGENPGPTASGDAFREPAAGQKSDLSVAGSADAPESAHAPAGSPDPLETALAGTPGRLPENSAPEAAGHAWSETVPEARSDPGDRRAAPRAHRSPPSGRESHLRAAGPAAPDSASANPDPIRPAFADTGSGAQAAGPGETLAGEADPVSDHASLTPEERRQLRSLAVEFTAVFSPAELRVMLHRAEANDRSRKAQRENSVRNLQAAARERLILAVDGDDQDPLRSLEEQLTALGAQSEARTLAALRETMALIRPFLAASRHEPFAVQHAMLDRCLARCAAQSAQADPGQNGSSVLHQAAALARRGLVRRESRFARDPAGYVADHFQLSWATLSDREFREMEGISAEDHLTRFLDVQEPLARGTGICPRLLPLARAASLREGYEGLDDPGRRTAYVRRLAASSGRYAVRGLAEVGLPMGLIAFARLLPDLARGECERLVRAAEAFSDSPDVPESRMRDIRNQVAGSPLTRALLLVDNVFSDSGTSAPEPSTAALVAALERFTALGGNLADLERRAALSETLTAADLAGDLLARPLAPWEGDTSEESSLLASGPDATAEATASAPGRQADGGTFSEERAEPSAPETASWRERQAHGLGVGLRGVVDGASGAADFAAAPIRAVLNVLNRSLGGAPDYFRPLGSSLSDALDLPRPQNTWEDLAHVVSRGGTEAMCLVWAANALLAHEAATSASSPFWNLVDAFRTGPGSQVGSGAGAEAAAYAAQSAGAGPLGSLAASLAGGMAGGAAVSRAGAGSGPRPQPGQEAGQTSEISRLSGPFQGLSRAAQLEQRTWRANEHLAAGRVDANGCLDIAGLKVPFGTRGADGRWETANDLFRHVSIPDLERSVLRGRAEADVLFDRWFVLNERGRIVAAASASPTGSLADMHVAVQSRINGQPLSRDADGRLVLGERGERLTSFNQRVTPLKDRGTGPVPHFEKLAAASKKINGEQAAYPNTTWDNVHAEMHMVQTAMKEGALPKGGTLEMVVAGKMPVCKDCQVHLPILAEELGLRFMTVVDKNRGVVYYWKKGMVELQKLGISSSVKK